MKKLLLLIATSAFIQGSALAVDVYSKEFQSVDSTELYEIVIDKNGMEKEILIPALQKESHTNQLMPRNNKKNKITLVELAESKKSTISENTGDFDFGRVFDNTGKVIKVTRDLIALGKEVYALIEKGKPVYTENSKAIQVLPRQVGDDLRSGFALQNWKLPVVKKFRYKLLNKFKKPTVTVEYMVIFTPGGDLDGKGKYISGAQIKPTYVDVKWGWNFSATYQVQTIVNQGTHEDPVAAAVLMIDFHSQTTFANRTESRAFAIDGLGNVTSY